MQSEIYALLSVFEETAFARVMLNDVDLELPAGTILTMAHCLHFDNGLAKLYVENVHSDLMAERIGPGVVFLDVGAATGAMSVPFAKRFPGVQIYAFEPAERAKRLLEATLIRNGLSNVEVLPMAVSDKVGKATFIERPIDPTGVAPFLPETSSLQLGGAVEIVGGGAFEVETTTLDNFATLKDIKNKNIVIKVDVEGYEVNVLKGAASMISQNDVFLSIDIHADPFGPGDTEEQCRKILTPFGYRFSREGHVLLCRLDG